MAANFMADHPARSSRPDQAKDGHAHSFSLHKFWLYETRSKFYLIGRDKKKTLWKVLKINRTEPCELNILEDASSYSESECQDFLNRINEGNKPTGGLRFVTSCYGIVGFVKFFGPYYMLLITKRKQIGAICGHAVYAITKSEIFSLGNSSVSPDVVNCRYESRYKKLFCSVDLTKDFFFSYSYHVMHSLQSNFCDRQNGEAMHGSMFVWNEFLTRGIRNHLKNTLWTVALVYGFFKQAKLSVSGKDFHLTLIARRSRHYAGTRYLKRGVNDKGKVANDVETEQIVFEDECRCGCPIQMSSVVQNRGSIPLFWSQETSRLNLKPDIILHRKDRNYEATRLHFENLVKRYGNPIIILNLIKTNEKRPRESILRAEFANAIDFINRDSSDEASLKFLHWDLHKHFRKKTTNVLGFLGRVAACALTSTGYFYCQVSPSSTTENTPDWPFLVNDDGEDSSYVCLNHNGADDVTTSGCGALEDCSSLNKDSSKFPKFQRGVLRTNCIDCLDRTNVAQYTYGLAALGHQLHELGLIDTPQIDLDTPLADTLMSFYETMGDTLALQYGGSAAHNKIFSQRRGQWKVTIQSQEFFRTLQRYYSNAYMDAEKQDAINVFLGYLRPLHGRSSLWDLDSDHHWNLERCNHGFSDAKLWSVLERSISDGNIHCESCIVESSAAINGEKQLTESVQPARMSEGSAMGLSVSTPEISTCDSDTSYSRCTPSEVCRREFRDGESLSLIGHSVDPSTFSNFLDLEWLSTSESSAEEISTRSSAVDGVPGGAACGGSTTTETTSAFMENGSMLTVSAPGTLLPA